MWLKVGCPVMKRWRLSWPPGQLAAYQKSFCSIKLLIVLVTYTHFDGSLMTVILLTYKAIVFEV